MYSADCQQKYLLEEQHLVEGAWKTSVRKWKHNSAMKTLFLVAVTLLLGFHSFIATTTDNNRQQQTTTVRALGLAAYVQIKLILASQAHAAIFNACRGAQSFGVRVFKL